MHQEQETNALKPSGSKSKLNVKNRRDPASKQPGQEGVTISQNFLSGSAQGLVGENQRPTSEGLQPRAAGNGTSESTRPIVTAEGPIANTNGSSRPQNLQTPNVTDGASRNPRIDDFDDLAENPLGQNLGVPIPRQTAPTVLEPRTREAANRPVNAVLRDFREGPSENVLSSRGSAFHSVENVERPIPEEDGTPLLAENRLNRPAGNNTLAQEDGTIKKEEARLAANEIERLLQKDQEKKLKKDDPRETVISMDNIQKTYLIGIEGVTAVRGVNLKVRRGEFLCILGTSGGGKSTLLNCMGTIDTPSRGTLKLFGDYMRSDTSDSQYAKIRLEKIGFVFQSFNLIGTMNSVENVELPMLLKGDLTPSQVKARAKELLTKVGLSHRLDHYPNQLSGGEQQRVTIARALSNEPELLLMDEPTGDLDTKNADKVVKILLDLNMRQENPITMVMVTHDEYMKQYAHRVVHIVDGKVNREEVMDPKIRQKAYKKISDIVQTYDNGTDAAIGVKEGAQATNVSGKSEIREVSDYAFMRFYLEKKQREAAKV